MSQTNSAKVGPSGCPLWYTKVPTANRYEPWYHAPSTIPPINQQPGLSARLSSQSRSPNDDAFHGSSAGPASSQTSVHTGSPVNVEQPTQQVERPWMHRITRGPRESLDAYITRMEAECLHKPRPVQGPNETKDDYSRRLWLRVYNKYCKRRSRNGERVNYDPDSDNTSDVDAHFRGPVAPLPLPQALPRPQFLASMPLASLVPLQHFQTPAHLPRNPPSANPAHGYGNARQQPLFRPYNDQEGRADTGFQYRMQAQTDAGARLQRHVRERARQGVSTEQFLRSTLTIPSEEVIFDETTSRFHGSFQRIAGFSNINNSGVHLALHPSMLTGQVQAGRPNTGAAALLSWNDFDFGPDHDMVDANGAAPGSH